MMNMMIGKDRERNAKRFWTDQERLFIMPLAEKQIMYVDGRSQMDTYSVS